MMESDWMVTKLQDICKNGDAYLDVRAFFKCCVKSDAALDHDAFQMALAEQIEQGTLRLEGDRVYLENVWRAEETAAECISERLLAPSLACAEVPEKLCVGETVLTGEQRSAVRMALAGRLSCVLGGAGSGKTTLIRAIVESGGYATDQIALCAPTGKAAQGLRQKTGIESASTIHRTLLCENSLFGLGRGLKNKQLVIIDESSMLTLEIFARLLEAANKDSRMVLLGDPNQLLAIGAGNILPDMRRIGVPTFELKCNHRQDSMDSALFYNVSRFDLLTGMDDLHFDDSFVFCETSDLEARRKIITEAVRSRNAGESIQVLTPRRDGTPLSAAELNRSLQAKLNPDAPGKACYEHDGKVFRAGDSVMVTANDAARNCFNGDVGRFSGLVDGSGFFLTLADGRRPRWTGIDRDAGLGLLELAYAMTIYKSQGSEFDTVLIPLPQSAAVLTRNLLYTAISRAKHRVVVYGTAEALEKTMKTSPHPRASKLPEKTLGWMERCA